MIQHLWKYLLVLIGLGLSLHLYSQQQVVGHSLPSFSDEPSAGQGYRAPPLPSSLAFAGEPVPLHLPDVAERLDRELLVNSYFHSNTLLALKRMQRYIPELERLLRENEVPDDFKYLALAESLFGNVTSPAGASGFWQLMPDTARGYGLLVNEEVDERYYLPKATVAACQYLKRARDRFGSWTNAAASYNRGMGGLDRALKKQGVSSYYDLFLNDETTRYLFRILALKEVLSNPQRYGFDFAPDQGYAPLPTRSFPVETSIPDLPKFALEQGTNYKILRLYNPWIRGYKLTVTEGKPQLALQLPL